MDPLSEEDNLNNDGKTDESRENLKTDELISNGEDNQVRNRQNIGAKLNNGSENVGDSIEFMESNPIRIQSIQSQTAIGEEKVEKQAKVKEENSGMWSKWKKFFSSSSTQPVNQKADDNIDGSARRQVSQFNQQESDVILGGIHKKKMLANGLLDFAFLSANVNQLHSNINSENNSGIIALISISIALQVIVSLLLIVTSYLMSKPDKTSNNIDVESAQQFKQMRWLNLIDHLTIAFVLIIAILNICIAAFSGSGSDQSTPSIPS